MMTINSSHVHKRMKEVGLTQVELSRRAGVSRARLSQLLNGLPTRVRATTLEKLATALRVPPGDLTAEGPHGHYLQWVRDECGVIELAGLGVPHPNPLPIDALHVPVRLRCYQGGVDQKREGECGEEHLDRSRPQPELSLEEAVGRARRLVLIGDPGCGKTTTLRRYAWHLANSYGAVQEPLFRLLPIFVRAVEWADYSDDEPLPPLAEHVTRTLRRSVSHDLDDDFEQALIDGRCVVLVDGLDEVTNRERRLQLEARLDDLLETCSENRVVLSCRKIGVDLSRWTTRDFELYEILPFDDEQIARFSDAWVRTHHGHPHSRQCSHCEEQLRDLAAAIDSSRAVREIASSPLLLAVLAALHHSKMALPRQRVELYRKVIETKLFSWERTKQSSHAGDLIDRISLGSSEFLWLLQRLAYEMQLNGQVLAPRWWLRDRIETFLREVLGLTIDASKAEAESLVEYLRLRCQLLVERGPDRYGFSHLSFQEYLSAQAIVSGQVDSPGSGRIDVLGEHLFDSAWSEVIRLVAASSLPVRSEEIVRALLTDPDPLGRFLHRGPLLAMDCLADGAVVADSALLDDLFESLVQTGATRWLGIPLRVISDLSSLHSTRYSSRARAALDDLLKLAESSLPVEDAAILRHQVDSNEQDDFVQKQVELGLALKLGEVRSIDDGEQELRVVGLDLDSCVRDRTAWLEQVTAILLMPSEPIVKLTILGALRSEDLRSERLVTSIHKLLVDSDSSVRAECALLVAKRREAVEVCKGTLKKQVCADENEDVREHCAEALGRVADEDSEVRRSLVNWFLDHEMPAPVRIGALRGLDKCLKSDAELRCSVEERLLDRDEMTELRAVCVFALEPWIDSAAWVREAFERLLRGDEPFRIRLAVANALGRATVEDRLPWSPGRVDAIIRVITGTESPCPHMYSLLHEISDVRRRREDTRLTTVLVKALELVGSKVSVAFVFGSLARAEQRSDSDIDLMIIGDVTLEELSSPIRGAERVLGREVNPITLTPTALCDRNEAGDPVVRGILQGVKQFLIGDENELGSLVENRLGQAT